MEKIIKKTISLTTKKRDSRNKLFEEFYSHDKNNAIFEFTVEGGVPTEDIVVLFHFKRTNRHLEVRGRVDNDKIIVNFDTSLIIKDEQVAGYIYYENGEKSNDVYRFMFDVHVSEIDKEHDLPVMEQESKRIVPLTDIVTKSEITELLKKIVANEKLYDDTEIKQQIESKADKETVQAISSKVEALEQKADNDTIYNDAEIRGQIATKADTQLVEAIAQRVQTLENKTDNDTVYNDTELRQAVENKADKEALLQFSTKNELKEVSDKVQQLESRPQVDISGLATKQEVEAISKVNVDNLVTKDELAQKGYLTAHQSLENVVTKQELEAKGYLTTHQDISNLVTKQELHEATEIDYSNIVTNDELESKHYLTEHQSLEELVTKSELEQKGYLTAHQSLEDYSKKAELDRVTERVQSLEARPQVDTSKLISKEELEQKNYLTSHQSLENVVTKQELESKGYLTNHQDLSEYAKKAEIPPQFDSKPLTDRIDLLESKAIANGAYNDKPLLDKIHEVQESLKGFITQSSRYLTEHQSLAHLVTKDELASKGYITNHQSLEHLVTKEELEQKGYLKTHQSLDNLVTKDELNSKGYLTAHQDISNLATNAKVEAVETRVQTLENKPPVDLSNLATKQELEAVRGSQLTADNHNFATKEELEAVRNSQSKVDTSNLVTKQELEDKHYLSSIPEVDTSHFVTRDELDSKHYVQDVSNLATNAKVDAVEARVQTLENKPPVDVSNLATKQELEAVRNSQQTVDTSNLVTKQELEDKHYIQEHQSLANLVTKDELESKGYLNAHQSLEEYAKKSEIPHIDTTSFATKEELSVVKQKQDTINAETYVTKDELAQKGYLTAHQDISNLATNANVAFVESRVQELENKSVVTHEELEHAGYLTEHQSLTDYAPNSKVEEVENRVLALENKPSVDTSNFATKGEIPPAYNDSELTQRISNLESSTVTKQELQSTDLELKKRLTALETNHVTKEELNASIDRYDGQIVTINELEAKSYLTAPQAESVYAKKSEFYNVASRVSALENKEPSINLANIVTKEELNAKGFLTAHQSLTDYAKKSEIPNLSQFATTDSVNNLLRTQGEQATKITALEAKSAYEIHGTGIPNGRVSAPIGTTYVDTAVTNGALKWIKESGNGNTGWKVLIGDTGWRTLNSLSRLGSSFIKIRRVNNLVTYHFGGLQWGWFGIGRRGGPGFVAHGSSGPRGAKVLGVDGIPPGFRTPISLVGPTFNDGGQPYGVWYLGGKSDSNYIQFTFNNEIPTDRDIGDIRVSAVSYLTDEDWPTTLP